MKPHRATVAENDVLTALQEVRWPLSLRELGGRLGLDGRDRAELKKTLKRLEHQGRVAEVRGGRYMLAERQRTSLSTRRGGLGGKEQMHKGGAARPAAGLDLIRGRLIAHRDGYGFVVPDQPLAGIEGDVFIPARAMGDALHGDRVCVRLEKRRPGPRGKRVEGRILAVEERANPAVVGIFHRASSSVPYDYVQPFEPRLPRQILIPAGPQQPPASGASRTGELDGAVVHVEITSYPGTTGGRPRGRVVEVLGRPGEFGIDIEIIIRKYHLPYLFPEEVLREARRVAQEIDPGVLRTRTDFRHLPIVTIDGEDARDFDDAVYVERLPSGHHLLQVHIADVAHYVRSGSPLDREARLRGTSVYFPDRAVPMLPVELSNGICSLNPEVDRLVMSCLMEINGQGEVVNYRFAEGVIHSAARMTYTRVNAALEGDPEVQRQHPALVPEFEKMRDLALILNAKRERRGSIDFDLPEPIIHFDEHGQMIGIARSERNIAHRLIEEFMLAANETVAGFLAEQGIASLYRVHETPDPQKVLEFEEIAASFGYSLGLSEQVVRMVRVKERDRRGRGGRRPPRAIPERLEISSRHYQRLADRIAGRPEERILSYLMLRSLKQARYAEQNLGHFALATPCYTHFTSPIRRYPDLIVHRLLKWALQDLEPRPKGELFLARRVVRQPSRTPAKGHDSGKPARGPYPGEELETIATESSEAERRADEAERELIEWKKLDFMEQHLGEEFDALVISIAKAGFWVELLELFVEGFVPLETLDPHADYYFREPQRAIVPGRRSQLPGAASFRLGDRVRVRLDRIDHLLKQIQFSVLAKL